MTDPKGCYCVDEFCTHSYPTREEIEQRLKERMPDDWWRRTIETLLDDNERLTKTKDALVKQNVQIEDELERQEEEIERLRQELQEEKDTTCDPH